MNEMEKAGLAPAVFESRRGVFKVTLYNKRINPGGYKLTEPMNKILSYCTQPRTRNEIAEYLGVDTASYVVARYLRPLIDMGKLRLTLPDTPKSKNQKYVIAPIVN